MNVLDLTAEDFVVLILALDSMLKHTESELLKARRHSNNAKQLAMLTMRQQITSMRTKIVRHREAQS
jgi:hypothetical protein